MKLLVDRGTEAIDKETLRLDKMISGSSVSESDRQLFKSRRYILDSFRESIPKIVR